MSMIGAGDNEQHSYLELMDALRQSGPAPGAAAPALGRPLVAGLLFPNADAFFPTRASVLAGPEGGRLSPV